MQDCVTQWGWDDLRTRDWSTRSDFTSANADGKWEMLELNPLSPSGSMVQPLPSTLVCLQAASSQLSMLTHLLMLAMPAGWGPQC